MLYNALLFLQEQLNSYFKTLHQTDSNIFEKPVLVENIAMVENGKKAGNGNALDNILITLVNISEETTLKNIPNYQKQQDTTVYKNPPIFLNLFVLFSVCMESYQISLIHLSELIKFFQAKSIFSAKNSSSSIINNQEEFNIVMDLYSPTFEQVNYLWSTLGGKQYPFVMYKLRVVIMEKESTSEIRGVIKEISLNNL